MNMNKTRVAGDFAVGCVVVLLCAIMLPLFVIVLKLAFWLALPLAIAAAAFIGVVLLGRVIRKIF